KTALLERQDGRVLNQLIEPTYNTFVVVIDGLRSEDVTPELMPNLTSLLGEECAPGGVCATEYEAARAMMVSETNSNHVAMMTGAYAAKSGMVANDTFDRTGGEAISLDRPELNLAETLFDAIEKQKPWLETAAVFGKYKLRDLFDCTTNDAGQCASNSANPESRQIRHVRPDFLGGASSSPSDPVNDCPAEPGTGSGYTTNACTMDVALGLLGRDDPDLTFINLPEVDAMSHLFGAGTLQAQAAVRSSDMELGRLIDKLRTSGRWQRSTVIVTADHNFGDTAVPGDTVRLDEALAGAGPSPFAILPYGGSASVYLTDLENLGGPLSSDQQTTLKQLRERALAADGVTEALYRLPVASDGGTAHTLGEVHPRWNLHQTPRVGELFIDGDETTTFAARQDDPGQLILGEHAHASDRHIPFFVLSGGTYVRDGTIRASGPVAEADDTGALPEQAENVDVAPTIAWLLGVKPPAQNQGRISEEAFLEHPRKAEAAGEITEPVVNRAAIFIYDQNNSITLHCLVDASTCGDPVPPEAEDPDFVPTLRSLAADGLFTVFGSVSAWPSVTFPNHNTVGSGAYPGHHGIPNNRFYVRETKELEAPIDPQDPRNPLYQGTSEHLFDDIETLHEAVHRSFGDWTETDGPTSDKAYTASVNEPSSRGADYTTLETTASFPNPAAYVGTANPSELAQDTTQGCAQSDEGYTTESELDHVGQTQARRLFEDTAQHPLPKYFINNFTLPDGSGHHFGVHTTCQIASYRDSDRRLARILDAMGSAGVLGETLIVVTGDHGSENQDLERRGLPSDFETVLNDAGIAHVMADWQVYLLTTDVKSSAKSYVRGREATATFTVTDDDTGDPIAGARVTVKGTTAEVTGETADDGTVALTFTPNKPVVVVTVTQADFNSTTRKYRAKKGAG
ncbi:MAG TPA: alkaline phosphatase family protein, partial [Actinomycetota bacterium]